MGILAVRADGDLCCRSGSEGREKEGGSWERERGRGVEVGWGQPGLAQDMDATWYRPHRAQEGHREGQVNEQVCRGPAPRGRSSLGS